jgi:hypothetical protein
MEDSPERGSSGREEPAESTLLPVLRRTVVLAHLVCLPLSLALGFALCGTDLGWSDSLVIARSPVLTAPQPSPVEYVVGWYTHLNGRVSQAVVASLVRLPFSRSPTPESFPFWVFAGLSLGCALLAVVLVGTSVARVQRAFLPGVVVAGLLLASWATNPVSFENVTYHHLAIFLAYMLPCYLTALWFWHALDLASGLPSTRGILLHAIGYLFLSAYVEVVLLTIPLLGILGWATAQRRQRRPWSFWARTVAGYAGLSVVAACAYWFSSGQRYRVAALGVGLPTTDVAPVVRLVRLVPVEFFGLSPTFGAVAYGVAVLGILGLLRSRRQSARQYASVSAVLFAAHGAALSPALSVDLPARTAIYPALLLVTSVALALLAAVEARCQGGAVAPTGGSTLWVVVVSLVAVAIAVAQGRECMSVQKERRQFFAVRQRIYDYVLGLHDHSGANGFVLTHCDLAPDGTAMEPPWGLQAYFGWARRPRLQVFIDTNYDFPRRPGGLEYTLVSCDSFRLGPGRRD